MSPDTWLTGGRFLTFADHKIFYRTEGTGEETLLFLHGFPTSSWDWHKMWSLLAPSYRLIAPDFLGYGFSDKPVLLHLSEFLRQGHEPVS